MKASAIEFRLRMLIQFAIVSIGIWAPWVTPWDIERRISALQWLAQQISRMGLASFTVAAPAVIVFAALLALAGAVLRVWGAAYLGYSVVHHGDMQAGGVMAAGPYRFMRNPLYLGGWFTMVAISLLLTSSGALFMIALITIFLLRLILGEEAFLGAQLGQPYQEYLRAVPRILPRFGAGLPRAEAQPHWFTALVTEIMPIGVFVTLAGLSWSYDNALMLLGVFVSFIASMVVRGLMKNRIPTFVFLVFAGATIAFFHLSWLKAVLIGFGAALIVGALLPRSPELKQQASQPE